jgi:hypothetical protein
MERLTIDKYRLTILFVLFITVNLFGQADIFGRYTWTDYPGSYITLNPDMSFKFKFRSHAYWDLACGQFKIKNDTITFNYFADMFDRNCISEGINFTDSSGVILQDAIDKSRRPISVRHLKNKLITIQVGHIGEPETVDFATYYYKRERNKKRVP